MESLFPGRRLQGQVARCWASRSQSEGTLPGNWEVKLFDAEAEGKNFSQIIRVVLRRRRRGIS